MTTFEKTSIKENKESTGMVNRIHLEESRRQLESSRRRFRLSIRNGDLISSKRYFHFVQIVEANCSTNLTFFVLI